MKLNKQAPSELLLNWPKGQLISKYRYEKSVSSKIPTKLFLDFCPEIFCSFVGASLFMILLVPRKPKKLPGSPQEATNNFRADFQIFTYIFVGILDETDFS